MDEDDFRKFESQFDLFERLADRQKQRDSSLGATVWDFLLRMDEELKELIERIGSIDPRSNFREYASRHLQVVTYLNAAVDAGLVPHHNLKQRAILAFGEHERREKEASPLATELVALTARLEQAQRYRGAAVAYLADHKAALLEDKSVPPGKFEELLEDRVLIHEAHGAFNDAASGDIQAPQEVAAFLPANIDNTTDVGLRTRAQRYAMGTFYVAAIDRFIADLETKVADLRRSLDAVQLSAREQQDLDSFRNGTHQTYNVGMYLHDFYRVLMANVGKLAKSAGFKL